MTLLEAKQLGESLLVKHGLTDYQIGFKKRMANWRVAGACYYKKKIIKLQPTFVEKNSVEVVTNTLLHEIAHGLMPKHGHNKFWKRKAMEIGCTGTRCYGEEVIK